MHDADDATLMAALRNADPLDPQAIGPHARDRLERIWSEARVSTAGATEADLQPWAPSSRRLQLVAAALVLLIVVGVGVVLARVISGPPAVIDQGVPPPASEDADLPPVGTDERFAIPADVASLLAAPPERGAVDGSYVAIVNVAPNADVTPDVFDIIEVVGGTARERFGQAWEYAAPASWRGFAPSDPAFMVERLVADDELFVKLRQGAAGEPTWYRLPGDSTTRYDRDLAATPVPTFTGGTRGFAPVDDSTMAESEMMRWSADVADADLEFLGPFSPTYDDADYAPGEARIDVVVDPAGRVRMVLVDGDEAGTMTAFGRFDGLAPITVPSGDVPVATDVHGMTIAGCGDGAAERGLRAQIDSVLGADPDVAAFEFLAKPTPSHDRIDGDAPTGPDDRLFVVAVRFDAAVDEATTYDRIAGAVDVTADVTGGDGFAYTCRTGSAHWIELGDQP